MFMVNTHEAKSRLSELISRIERGEDAILICRNGRPVAELRAVARPVAPLRTDPELARVKFFEDPASPLHPEDWPEPADAG
jgi:prevent-host-death family protein